MKEMKHQADEILGKHDDKTDDVLHEGRRTEHSKVAPGNPGSFLTYFHQFYLDRILP